MKLMRSYSLIASFVLLGSLLGCGSPSSNIPTAISAEEEQAMQEQQKKVEAEEMAHRQAEGS
jgi:hypothetical protein